MEKYAKKNIGYNIIPHFPKVFTRLNDASYKEELKEYYVMLDS